MMLKKLFVYTCFLIREFPLLKELMTIIITLMKQIPRPKILCTQNNSAILFKDRLYIWGGHLRLPRGNLLINQHRPLQLNLSNISLFTFYTTSTMILSKNNEIFLYGQYAINGKCKSFIINSNIPKIRKIIRGWSMSLMLTTCGKVYMFKDGDGKILLEYLHIERNEAFSLKGPNSTNVKNIIFDYDKAYILHFDGNLYFYGSTDHGFDSNFGVGPLLSNITKLSKGGLHYVAVDKNGIAYSWGEGGYGQLGIGRLERASRPQKILMSDIVSVSCGLYHTILTNYDNKIFGCGSNGWGQLGLGNMDKVYKLTKINIDNVIAVSCGDWHTMVLTLTNQIYVFGLNKEGQLGIGSTVNCKFPTLLKYPFDPNTTD